MNKEILTPEEIGDIIISHCEHMGNHILINQEQYNIICEEIYKQMTEGESEESICVSCGQKTLIINSHTNKCVNCDTINL